ncbi:MAG TPA: plasma-membrane proton-efflux P-type ATPase [Thermoplasmata archaeon]|nr:plasma-membrane proton-efflux P-type ATPase [Thermoplasmata archaeon]
MPTGPPAPIPPPVGPAPTSPPAGLTTAEASARRARDGYNEVAEPTVSAWRKVLSYFWGPIPWMIEAALVLSVLLAHWDDVAIIATLLAVNAAVGLWEEHQAGDAVAALKARLSPQARVLRDGAWTTIPARELVTGDVVRVRLGDILPADVLLLGDAELELDQSALTGESLPVTRSGGGSAYAGSTVRRGEATAQVTATGTRSYLGRTTQLVAQAQTVSHLQQAVLRIGDTLIMLAIGIAIVVELVSLLRGVALLTSLEFALVLTIAAIPVAMPTVLSVTLAVGARSLARDQAIVTHLESVEELAGMDVLCSDKTGTLTQNRLAAGAPLPLGSAQASDVQLAGALASRPDDHDPIDDAILAGFGSTGTPPGYRRTDFRPFDPVVKRTEATYVGPEGQPVRVSKGAPQAILRLVGADAATSAAVSAAIEEVARRGFRALGVARADADGPWRYLGIVPLSDPLRPDSAEVIAGIRALGVDVKMVTGDQSAIAAETARQLGLPDRVLTPTALAASATPEARGVALEQASVFAEVFPEHKYEIVETLQQRGHIVGMTGDGVNDAPALKKADAGIAVSGATDAARAAADVVLTASGLGVLLTAIHQARQTFARMTAYAIYRIEETIRLLLFIGVCILALGFFPVTALMIVLIALLNDGAILAIAYDRTPISPTPVSWRMGSILRVASTIGVVGVASSFALLSIATGPFHISGGALQTLLYLKLSVAGHFVIFVTRTKGPFWKSRPAGVLVLSVIGTQLLASVFALGGWFLTPIPWTWVVALWGYAALEIVLVDLVKQATYRREDRIARTAPARPPPTGLPPLLPGRWFVHPRHRHLARPASPSTARATGLGPGLGPATNKHMPPLP